MLLDSIISNITELLLQRGNEKSKDQDMIIVRFIRFVIPSK